LSEPACDLGAAAAIWSSMEEKPVPQGWVFIGELGLTGEVRRVTQSDLRMEEAKKLGFKTLVIPQSTPKVVLERFANDKSIRVITISKIDELPKLFVR